MTRGRESNIAYVALDQPDDSHSDARARRRHRPHRALRRAPPQRRKPVRAPDDRGRVRNPRRHRPPRRRTRDHRRRRSTRPFRGTPAPLRAHPRAARSGRRSRARSARSSASLRRAEAYHHDLEKLVPRIVGQHALDDADDIAAVLRYRIEQAAASPPRDCRLAPRLIAGLIPNPWGRCPPSIATRSTSAAELIEARARSLVAAAVDDGAPWCRRLGTPPTEPRAKELWVHAAMTVAAYRDRYKIDSDVPLGGGATTAARAGRPSTSTTRPARGSTAVARSPTSAPPRGARAACRLRALSEFETSCPEVRVPLSDDG